MKLEILLVFAIVMISIHIGHAAWPQLDTIPDFKNLEVQFSDNPSQNYNVLIPTGEKFILSQSYSWSRDQNSRYNLVGYTIDGSDFVEIPRKARGNYTLDVLMDSDHTVVFKVIVQYPIEIEGIQEFDSSPKSPTSDNWFDSNSEIEFSVPFIMELEKERTRLQLKNWSLDNSLMKKVILSDNNMLVTPKIKILDSHKISLEYQTQHKVEVHSSMGEIKGAGWYDAGATSTITAIGEKGIFGSEFERWQGLDEESNENPLLLVVDSPKILQAEWKFNYSPIIILAIVATIGIVVIFLKNKGKTVVAVSHDIGPYENPNYDSEIREFYRQKTLESVSKMFEQQLISQERIEDLQKKLETHILQRSDSNQEQS